MASADEQKWVQVGDFEYDVTSMWKKHPGGAVIRSFLGQDATNAFNQVSTVAGSLCCSGLM